MTEAQYKKMYNDHKVRVPPSTINMHLYGARNKVDGEWRVKPGNWKTMMELPITGKKGRGRMIILEEEEGNTSGIGVDTLEVDVSWSATALTTADGALALADWGVAMVDLSPVLLMRESWQRLAFCQIVGNVDTDEWMQL